MKLKDLYDLLHGSHTPIKVRGSGTGKVLIYHYNPITHAVLNDLDVYAISPEIECKRDFATARLVVHVSDSEYAKLKQEGMQ